MSTDQATQQAMFRTMNNAFKSHSLVVYGGPRWATLVVEDLMVDGFNESMAFGNAVLIIDDKTLPNKYGCLVPMWTSHPDGPVFVVRYTEIPKSYLEYLIFPEELHYLVTKLSTITCPTVMSYLIESDFVK